MSRPDTRVPPAVPLRLLIAVVAAGLVVAACGGGESDSGSDSARATRPPTTGIHESTVPEHNEAATAPAGAEPESPPSTADTITTTATTASSVSDETNAGSRAKTARPDTFIPAPGSYRYSVEGWTETRKATDNTREEHHGEQTDQATVEPGAPTKVTVLTSADDNKTQELRYHASADVADLVQLTTWEPGRSSPAFVITPSPPIPVAHLPYRVGETWEFTWRDDKVGVQGAGTGTTLRTEQLDTPNGPVEVAVIEVRQSLSGAFTSDLVTTSWVARSTGIQWQQRIISDSQDATGRTRTETARTLDAMPT